MTPSGTIPLLLTLIVDPIISQCPYMIRSDMHLFNAEGITLCTAATPVAPHLNIRNLLVYFSRRNALTVAFLGASWGVIGLFPARSNFGRLSFRRIHSAWNWIANFYHGGARRARPGVPTITTIKNCLPRRRPKIASWCAYGLHYTN